MKKVICLTGTYVPFTDTLNILFNERIPLLQIFADFEKCNYHFLFLFVWHKWFFVIGYRKYKIEILRKKKFDFFRLYKNCVLKTLRLPAKYFKKSQRSVCNLIQKHYCILRYQKNQIYNLNLLKKVRKFSNAITCCSLQWSYLDINFCQMLQ